MSGTGMVTLEDLNASWKFLQENPDSVGAKKNYAKCRFDATVEVLAQHDQEKEKEN